MPEIESLPVLRVALTPPAHVQCGLLAVSCLLDPAYEQAANQVESLLAQHDRPTLVEGGEPECVHALIHDIAPMRTPPPVAGASGGRRPRLRSAARLICSPGGR